MQNIYKFGGKQHVFSNFYPTSCVYEDVRYANTESAFQAAKTLDLKQRKAFEHCEPSVAKRMGKMLDLRPDWEEVKYGIMLEILRSKFQDSRLREKLLCTGDMLILEDTTGRHDNIWGDCGCSACAEIEGQNLLGKALMELRQELRAT